MSNDEVILKAKQVAKANTELLEAVKFKPELVEKAFELVYRQGHLDARTQMLKEQSGILDARRNAPAN